MKAVGVFKVPVVSIFYPISQWRRHFRPLKLCMFETRIKCRVFFSHVHLFLLEQVTQFKSHPC